MPEMSSARTFVRALQTRMTKSTKALDVLFANDPNSEDHPQKENPNFVRLQEVGALSSGPNEELPFWAKKELLGVGLSFAEVEHIGRWPADQREDVRAALITVIEENQPIEFFWDLHSDNDEETAIEGDTITFLSPRSKVYVIGRDNIVVNVGSEDEAGLEV